MSHSSGQKGVKFEWEPGSSLEPGLLWRPRARMTSTSRFPLLSHRLNWMSPSTGEPSTWRPTNWPGPRPANIIFKPYPFNFLGFHYAEDQMKTKEYQTAFG